MEKLICNYVNFLTNERKMAENTVASYHMDINRYIEYFGVNDLNALRTLDSGSVYKYFAKMKSDGIASSTITRHVSSIRSFYRFLQCNKILSEDPTTEVTGFKVTRKAPEILNEKEMKLLLKQPALNTLKGRRDKAMLELVCSAGLRAHELTSMLIDDVDLEKGQVVCSANKNRIVVLPESALSALREYIEKSRPMTAALSNSRALFLNCSNGRNITRQGFWKFVKMYQKQAEIEKPITPKILRHSFAAYLVANNTEVKTIQKLLGHNDFTSTQLYIQLIKQALNSAKC